MDELSKRRKWRRWLSAILAETERLCHARRLFNEVKNQVRHDPEWEEWLENLYLVGVSLVIRRLADPNARHRTISLVKLLQDMERHSGCLSRLGALRANPASRRAEVQQLFDQFAGLGSVHMPQAVIRQWREDFERVAEPFRAWVDHRIAHFDLCEESLPPTCDQIEQVLNHLDDAVIRLRLLLGA